MFGKNLHKIMQAQKISGKELSRSTGISESTISKFLSGNQEPRYSQIIQLAKAVNLPPGVFISVISSQYDTTPPMINECCLLREIYKDAASSLRITTLHSFKEFTLDLSDGIYDEAIYVSVILKGGTDSKLGSLRAGDYQIVKGTEYKGMKATVLKDTMLISYKMFALPEDTTKSWFAFHFDGLESQKMKFLK